MKTFKIKIKKKEISDLKLNNIDAYKLRGESFYKSLNIDRKKIFKKFEYLLTKKEFECPLCSSRKKKKIFLKVTKNYILRKCKDCDLVFPNINLNKIENYEDIIYKKYSNNFHSKNKLKKKNYRKKFISDRFNYCIEKNFKNFKNLKKLNVLEIGCGTGEFLKHLKEKKIKYKGIELDPQQLQIAQNNKLNVDNNNLKIEKNNEYNLVLMFDVLEHIVNPLDFIKLVTKKLKKNGLLICYIPNINSIGFELMKEKQNLIYPFEHISFFNEKSLNYLSKKGNLKIKKIETFGLDLIDYFFFKEFYDKKKYINKLSNFIDLLQSVIDNSGLANHYRVTFKK